MFIKSDKQLNNFFQQAYNPQRAETAKRFFKTGPNQYAFNDKFIGVNVPTLHTLAKKYYDINDKFLEELLASPYHEIRLLGALIMKLRYEKAVTETDKLKAFNFYLQHRYALNNWDLIDLTASKVIGDYLLNHAQARKKLYQLASSDNIWERRLAIVSTLTLIKAGSYQEIFTLTLRLSNDKEDLIVKALGWMLREVGKKEKQVLVNFLKQHAHHLPRLTLRYALEHFSQQERQKYLNKT